jgi:hypothetical protein
MAIDTTKLPDTGTEAEEAKGIDVTKLPNQAPNRVAKFEDPGAVSEEQTAKSLINSLSFGIDADDDAKDPAILEAAINDKPSARNTITETENILDRSVRRRVPELRRAPEPTTFQKLDSYFKDLFGITAREQGEAVLEISAREQGITVEELKRQVFPEGEGLRRVSRFGRGIGAGAVGTLEGLGGFAQFLTDGEIGTDLANQAQLWRDDLSPSPEEVDFSDNVASGVGSMAVFFVPGFGVAQGMKLVIPVSRRAAAWGGTTVMTSLEASTEAGLVWRDMVRKTGSKEEADKAATTTYWLNMPLLLVTNKLGIFAENGSVIARAGRGAVLEGTQEAAQEGISGFATSEMPTFGEFATAFGVGALTGGGVAAIQGAAQAKADRDITADEQRFIDEAQAKAREPEEIEAVTEPVEAVPTQDIDTLIEQGLTDDQIAEQIIRGVEPEAVTDTLEGVPEEAQIIETLSQVEDEAADAPLEELGRRAFAEGSTDEQTFTQAMKTKLGELWDRFKGRIKRIFESVKAFNERLGRRGEITFGEEAPVFPELQFDQSGKVQFDIENRLQSVIRFTQEGGRVFQSIKELKGRSKEDIINTINKMINNEELTTETEQAIADEVLDAVANQFFTQVQESKGEFIDATELLAEGELETIIDAGIEEFSRTIKTREIKPKVKTKAQLDKEQIATLTQELETTKQVAREKTREVFEFEDILEEERGAAQEREEALKSEIKAQIAEVRKARTEGRREAAETAKTRIEEIRTTQRRQITAERIQRAGRLTLIDTMVGNLPMSLRARFLKPLANAKTPKQLSDVGERIIDAINKYQESLRIKKNLGTKRSKIAYIRKINEINQTVINDIKKELDITKPLSKMDETELDRVLEKLLARVRFKRSRGYKPPIEGRGTRKPDIPESLYEVNRNNRPSTKQKVNKKISNTVQDAGHTVEAALGVISTRLANVSPKLRSALRKFEFNLMTSIQKDKRAIVPYLNKVKTMTREDQADMDLALKNGDTAKIDALVDKYDMVDEFVTVRKTLDALYGRANNVGYDIGYRENYFPRMIKDSAGFLQLLSEREDWSILDEAIKRKELDLGRYLNEEEKANLINNMVRGYSGGQITLSATGNMKERIIDFVTPEMNVFYQDTTTSLVNYIDSVNEAIESRKFFGKEKAGPELEDQFGTELDDSIGAYITNLMTEGVLKPEQEKEIRSILTARFSQKGTRGTVGVFKNLAYLTVMGSVFNAITQIGDLSFTIYAGGLKASMPEIAKAALGKSVIKKEDLGIERIATEMEDPTIMSQLVDNVFRITGLTAIDRVGKEALVNSVVRKFMNQAQEAEIPTELTSTLNEVFGPDADAVLADLQNEFISENVKYLAFSELLNFQPIALSEVPELYLRGGNGRIFYMLKTWTIKMFDVYRNEVYNQMKTDPTQALKNLINLTILLVAMNGTADILKDLLLGREIKLDDLVIDNIAKLIGFSRYTTFQVQREGLGSAVGQQILPPTKLIDDVSRDTIDLFKDWDENAKADKLRTPENIPVIGKLYYWWFGKGVEKKQKRKRPKRGE